MPRYWWGALNEEDTDRQRTPPNKFAPLTGRVWHHDYAEMGRKLNGCTHGELSPARTEIDQSAFDLCCVIVDIDPDSLIPLSSTLTIVDGFGRNMHSRYADWPERGITGTIKNDWDSVTIAI